MTMHPHEAERMAQEANREADDRMAALVWWVIVPGSVCVVCGTAWAIWTIFSSFNT